MNVVLARLYNPSLGIITPPLGIGYLLQSLAAVKGIRPIFIDGHLLKMNEKNFISEIKKKPPALLGIQVYSIDYSKFSRLLPLLKKELPDTFLVAGGPHVTALPEYTLSCNPELDFIICGEGETALPKLVRALLNGNLESRLPHIPNLAYRKNGTIRKNKTELIDVNTCGNPAWNLLHPHKYPAVQHGTFHKSTRVVPIITSRGCPYPCTFCAGFLTTGKTIRLRDIKNVVDEIEYLKTHYGFEEFIIEDENFTFHKYHVIGFADEIQKRGLQCSFSFPNGIRLDRLDEEIIRSLSAMGTYMVVLGIESVSRNTLERMKKSWSKEQIVKQIQLLKKYKIIVQANFILGFRDDTIEDIQQSIDFAMEINIDQVYFGNYIPLPGTEDFSILLERGEISLADIHWKDYNSFYGQYPYHPQTITAKECTA